MENKEPICTEQLDWKGNPYLIECFDSIDISEINPIKQVQVVCFTNNDSIILYKHTGGWNGLPGGGIEENENWEDALKRELKEEAGVEAEKYGIIGYERVKTLDDPENVFYFLRCWAKVKELDYLQNDPDKKSLGRIVLDIKEASEKLGYGEKGRVWIKLAREKIKKDDYLG